MPKQNNDYISILKSTSLFGVVQVFSILISIIRSKVIAIWIGPIGIGVIGLLNSTIGLIGEFTKLGIDTTAVRDIAYAKSNDRERIPIVVSSLRKIVWFTGLLGVIVTLISSPLLSKLAFGNYDYTLAFVLISTTLLFKQLSSGQLAILQGLKKLRFLAKANLIANFIGLLITLPLYYYFRIDAIVPSIIIISIVNLFFSWWYSRQIKIKSIKVSNREALSEGRQMLKLGFMLSLRGLISLAALYALQIFISRFGSVTQVGFYTAGFVILNSYVGLIFNAMRTDYFPRLMTIIDDEVKVRNIVMKQSLIALLIVTPIIVLFLTLAPTVVEVLYSEEFLVIVGMVSWGILATVFKCVSWSMGYVILAKGDSGLFIKTAVLFNILLFSISAIGYSYYGLVGLGVGFLIYYILHFLIVKFITYKTYNLYFNKEFYFVFFMSILFCFIAFFAIFLEQIVLKYSLMILVILISTIFTILQLNKRINIIETFKDFKNRKN